MPSNHGGYQNNLRESTLEKKVFQMVPLLYYSRIQAIYTIHLKYSIIGPFNIIFCWFGRAFPDRTRVNNIYLKKEPIEL